MTADFDEYDYLEQQVEKKPEPSKEADAEAVKDDEKEPAKDKEEKDDRGRDEKRKSEKSSRRDRSGSRSKKPRSRSRSRDRDSRRDREHKSRDRDREHKSRDREHKSRDRDREHKSRGRDDERERPSAKRRERTPPEVRSERERQRELEALERDTRTVFAFNVSTRASDREIFEFFSQAGTVMDVRIITDRNTKRSKGFAYIEMGSQLEVGAALALQGQPLLGQAVMVKASEAEKNMAWEAQQAQNQSAAQQSQKAEQSLAASGGGIAGLTGPAKLQVSSIHPNVKDEDLKSIFEPFGPLDFAEITKDAAGNSMGTGFVQYSSMGDSLKAIQELHNLEIAGLKIQVTVAPLLPIPILPGLPGAALPGMEIPGLPGANPLLPGAIPGLPGAPAPESNVNDLDDEGQGGLKLSGNTRAALMARLAGNTMPAPPVNPLPPGPPQMPSKDNPLAMEQGVLGPKSPIPTPCILLKNMFDPTTETEPDWDIEIGEDVKDECSKYGPVLHHHVDKNSKGFIYFKFAATDAGSKAQMALNGRWFAGREVIAEYQFAAVYDSHFKC